MAGSILPARNRGGVVGHGGMHAEKRAIHVIFRLFMTLFYASNTIAYFKR